MPGPILKLCPSLQAQGTCALDQCAYSHDVKICEPCGVVCFPSFFYEGHVRGRKHRAVLSGRAELFRCPVCEHNVAGESWPSHLASDAHRDSARRARARPEEVEPEQATLPGWTRCELCAFPVQTQLLRKHYAGKVHKQKERYAAFKAALEEGEKDKHGVVVSHGDGGLDFGIVDVQGAQRGFHAEITVSMTIPASQVVLDQVKLFSASTKTASPFKAVVGSTLPVGVRYGRSVPVEVHFTAAFGGRYDTRLELVFEDTSLRTRFAIVRTVRATVGDEADHELLKPVAPFVPRKRAARDREREVVPGVRPPALDAITYIVPLPNAAVPKAVEAVLSTGTIKEIVARLRSTLLPPTLDSASYGRHFKTLLWIEEDRMEHDLEVYDIPKAKLSVHGPYYYVDVPGLAEKRPSVIIGDRILVRAHDAPAGQWFEGGVHVVRQAEVGLRFHSRFRPQHPGQLYHVRFKLNRIPLRRQHQALDTAFAEARILFPTREHLRMTTCPKTREASITVFNPLIARNEPQLQAVVSILRQPPGSLPFVVFGPPGTGKTVTIVEAIRQLVTSGRNTRILALAPSNSAADLIASRLAMLGPDQVFRLYAPSRLRDHVPDELLDFTYEKDGHFSVPIMPRMRQFRVIVATAVSASIPYGIGMARGHFTHIFIDEAGQASEPEVMIGVKTVADSKTNLILSGDPKQLGPIIRSAVARALGLETSCLQRLMDREVYDEHAGYGMSVVKLINNFRSHESILKFPNERFYRGDLRPCGAQKTVNSFIGWSKLPNAMFPIIFHSILGKDDREASSPSFFNIDEITQVKAYVRMLRDERRYRTTDADIGVIAPYHAQCTKIRTGLRAIGAAGIKVGTVEDFQGQERRVIIISTVRSSKEFVEYDLKHTLGFVANPRRFNVAVTRAQALLIVVGDPNVLSLDPLWRSFLNYVDLKGGWTGQAGISWDPLAAVDEHTRYDHATRDAGMQDMNDFTRRMEELTLRGVVDENNDIDEADVNVDRPWREVE